VAGSLLGSGVHFLPILLVLKNNCYVVGELEEVRISEQEDTAGPGSEHDASHADPFGATQPSGLGVLARAHCEEECSKDEVGRVCVSGHSSVFGAAGQELVEFS
jgi:hypothetical protein